MVQRVCLFMNTTSTRALIYSCLVRPHCGCLSLFFLFIFRYHSSKSATIWKNEKMTSIGLEFFNSWIGIIFSSILFDSSKKCEFCHSYHPCNNRFHSQLTCLPTKSLLANLLNCDFRGKVQEKLQKLLLADLEAILLCIIILKK